MALDTFENTGFYLGSIRRLQADGRFGPGDTVLVVNGGSKDFRVFRELGFSHVTIANLDERIDGASPFEPYAWSFQDTEHLQFDDGSFDYVVVHSGLHHLRCPEKGITEMYRVARKGVLGFEPHDCLYTRLGVKLGFGQEYETGAVYHNELKWGGVANTAVPNYVYRFSRRDIIKTIQVNRPIGRHTFRFFYATRIPGRLLRLKQPVYRWVGRGLGKVLETVGGWSPVLANNIGFYIDKEPAALFPWLRREGNDIVPDREVLDKMYLPPPGESDDSSSPEK